MSLPRIIVIAVHPLVRKGIGAIVAEEFPGASLIFLEGLPEGCVEAELLVYDSETQSGVPLENLRDTNPLMPILVFNLPSKGARAGNRALSGSHALLAKDADIRSFTDAMHVLINGRLPLLHPTVKPDGLTSRLSRRELEIFSILGQEIPVRIIAKRLGISVKTVETHRESIKNKLGFHTASEVVLAAANWLSSRQPPTHLDSANR